MNKEEALDKFDPFRGSDAIYDFIEYLYRENYLIVKQKAGMTKYPNTDEEEEWIRIK
ncbi:hypothetical protein KAR91_73835 [Candidatus Pacearchaeota archaeon]|nr:hypothetical protein [Candidatus Pacearchaeota archaeon]